MIIKHIKASDLNTSKWSGGTTSQLAIHPNDASYQEQNFLFRISTARVEVEESTFTKLPGISRKLMILEGEIKIEHQNHYSKTLKKFDQDEFSGDWNTKSYGKATDFNIMSAAKTKGEIEAIVLESQITHKINSGFDFYGFYVYTGEINISINNNEIKLLQGDFLSINCGRTKNEILILSNNFTETILTQIKFA